MASDIDYEDALGELDEAETRLERIRYRVRHALGRLKLGIYDEARDGDLLTVLEEIERILR